MITNRIKPIRTEGVVSSLPICCKVTKYSDLKEIANYKLS